MNDSDMAGGGESDASDEYGAPSKSRNSKRRKTTRQNLRQLAHGMGNRDSDADDDGDTSMSDSRFVRVNSRSGQRLPNYNEEKMHTAFSDSEGEFEYYAPGEIRKSLIIP